tara:strand:+ start:143 stop:487 length:345 start_codon:yes stop_codon:yes gene_type:complete
MTNQEIDYAAEDAALAIVSTLMDGTNMTTERAYTADELAALLSDITSRFGKGADGWVAVYGPQRVCVFIRTGQRDVGAFWAKSIEQALEDARNGASAVPSKDDAWAIIGIERAA